MKTIGIYNPYLETKGGGEKVCLALAQTLADLPDCKVFLLAPKKLALKELGQYFDLNLSKVQVIPLPKDNAFAKLVHRLPLPGRVRNLYFDLRASRFIRRHNFDLFINNCIHSNLPNPSKQGVYMCMFPHTLSGKDKNLGPLKAAYIGFMNFLNRLLLHPGKAHAIDTYDLITANSAYTQGYITKLWQRDSTILYPICEDMADGKPAHKKNLVMHVGRFFENSGENHHKRHDALLDAFAGLPKLHKDGWELHLAGTVAEDVGALKYILKLMKQAQGLPVYFHFNSSFADIKKLYNDATMYWHATGFGSNPLKHPEKQEHFGIVTVEAMSAGCIPLVINTAGQKEVVSHRQDGFLWDSKKQLQDLATKVAQMSPSDRKTLSTVAKASATRFNNQAFAKQVQTIFGEMLL